MMKPLLKKAKPALAVSLAGLVALGSIGTALASPAAQAQDRDGKLGVFGDVTAKTEDSFSLKTKQGATMELTVTGDTSFRILGEAVAGLDELEVGSRVAVLAESQGDVRNALKVMAVPGQPQREHRVLTVVDASGTTVVAEDAEGNQVEVELEHGLSEDLRGQLVTFIGARSEQSNRFKARAEVKVEQVIKRLQRHAEEVEAEVEAEVEVEARARKEERLERLKARLEANMERHVDVLTEVIAKAPAQAKESLRAALEMTLKGHGLALEALGEAESEVEAHLEMRRLSGSVTSVDTENGQVTIQTGRGAQVTLSVTEETEIRIGEEPGTLADVAMGDRVGVRFNSETEVATVIWVRVEAKAEATVRSVDAPNGQIVVEVGNDEPLTLNVGSDAEIEVNGEDADIGDIEENVHVEVRYNTRTMNLLELEAESRAEVEGTIQGVDIDAGTVTVLTEDGDEVTLTVSDGTRVRIKGLLFGLLGVNAGMKIEAKYDTTTGDALEIKAEAEKDEGEDDRERVRGGGEVEARGTIVSVDATSSEVVVEFDGGRVVNVRTDAETEIEVNGEEAALSDLEAGLRVKVELNPQSGVASEIEVRAEVKGNADAGADTDTEEQEEHQDGQNQQDEQTQQDGQSQQDEQTQQDGQSQEAVEGTSVASASGTLEAVSVANNTITVSTGGSDSLVLNVTSDTEIAVNASTGPLAALVAQVGGQVTVEYDVETGTATRITIGS